MLQDYQNYKANKYKIGEAYLKLNIEFNKENNKSIRTALKKAVEKELKDFKYKDGLLYLIVIEKGSLKSKVIIYGAVIFTGISNYGSIRQGITQMYEDMQWMGTRIIEYTKNEDTRVNNNTIIRSERRTGLIGRLKRVIEKLDELENKPKEFSDNALQQELKDAKQDLVNILELLNEQEKGIILDKLSQQIKDTLPKPNQDETRILFNRYAIKPEDFVIEEEID